VNRVFQKYLGEVLMDNLKIFSYKGKDVRAILKDNTVLVVLKDICDVLEIENSRDVAARLDDREKDAVDIIYASSNGIRQNRTVTAVNEAGLYNAILLSRKPEAKELLRWVKEQMLPEIWDDAEMAGNKADSPDIMTPIRFENSEFGDLEILFVNERAIFPGIEMALKLGYANPRKAILDHCEQKGVTFRYVLSPGGMQKKKYISEGNLYRLIVHSKLPGAEQFEKWVFDEVLPIIRKHGMYTKELAEKERALSQLIIENKQLIEEKERAIAEKEHVEAEMEIVASINSYLQLEAIENEPKVNFADAIMATDDLILLGDLSKIAASNGIKIGQNRIYALLRKKKLLTETRGAEWNAPTQKAMDLGLFKVCERVITTLVGLTKIVKTTYATPKGQDYILRKLISGEWKLGED
jgi:prophage antirepressor-like protein